MLAGPFRHGNQCQNLWDVQLPLRHHPPQRQAIFHRIGAAVFRADQLCPADARLNRQMIAHTQQVVKPRADLAVLVQIVAGRQRRFKHAHGRVIDLRIAGDKLKNRIAQPDFDFLDPLVHLTLLLLAHPGRLHLQRQRAERFLQLDLRHILPPALLLRVKPVQSNLGILQIHLRRAKVFRKPRLAEFASLIHRPKKRPPMLRRLGLALVRQRRSRMIRGLQN